MKFNSAALIASASLAAAAPVDPFPLPDGFPNPSDSQIKAIEVIAGGTLSNAPPPPNPNSPAVSLDLQVVAFNEIFEVAYFTDLLRNVTNGVSGYEVSNKWDKAYIEKVLAAVIAQEELHAINANGAIKAFGGTEITPAKYQFPVNSLKDAIDFAGIFTELVLGALQSVQVDLTKANAAQLVQGVGSIMEQEAEQTGFYRAFNNLIPSSSPFLTNAPGAFGYNALIQNVIVPGSNKNKIDVPLFEVLTVNELPEAKDTTVHFTTKVKPSGSDSIVYISGQNLPVVEEISNVQSAGDGIWTFEAAFPYASKGFSRGLTIAALTNCKGPFESSGDVAAKTLAGPGLIPVD